MTLDAKSELRKHTEKHDKSKILIEKELYVTMSTVINNTRKNGIYVVMEWEKSNTYRVASYICHHDGRCGYPIKEMTYSINEKKNAEATFRRYVKKYCKGE